MKVRLARAAASCAVAFSLCVAPLRAQTAFVPQTEAAVAMTLTVDASDATRSVIHVRESIPLAAGAHVLVYPKWIPGEHAPNGPLPNVATLVVKANGQTIPWTRDVVDLYAFRIDVPPGASAVDVSFDYLGAEAGQYSSSRLATPTLFSLTWNKFVLYPDVADIKDISVTPSLILPGSDWTFATALTTRSQSGTTVDFAPVTMERLIDSPLDAGTQSKRFPLGSIDGAPVDLAVFADTAAELDIPAANLARLRNLVREMGALYRARHFDHYTFLLTTSDVMPGEGVEHHQSSDDGTEGQWLSDPEHLLDNADLLPHEFNHSWDGKYRRPGDLLTPNLQVPMADDLLWVYEGMTQFYGKLQAERSGLLTKQQWLDSLAQTYSSLDFTTGRLTRPLLDTATSGPFLYGAPRQFERARRSVDFYEEGTMMWLEADVIIRARTGGKKSIDDFARAFFGRTSTGPIVVPFAREDVIAALNEILPYDWKAFIQKRVDEVAPHPPDPFTPGGYRLVYTEKPSEYVKKLSLHYHALDYGASAGFIVNTKEATINDVVFGSPAAKAGLSPGLKIVGVNGRTLDADGAREQIDGALVAAKTSGSMQLLVTGGETYRTVTIAYRGGPRYPHLERIAGTPDQLGAIAAPLGAAGYERPIEKRNPDAP